MVIAADFGGADAFFDIGNGASDGLGGFAEAGGGLVDFAEDFLWVGFEVRSVLEHVFWERRSGRVLELTGNFREKQKDKGSSF